jgi:ferritin
VAEKRAQAADPAAAKTPPTPPAQTKFLSTTMAELLAEQVGNEAYSFYLYMALDAYADNLGLDGFAKYFGNAAEEELKHTKKVHQYLMDTGTVVALPAIKAPPGNPGSMQAAVEAALEHERKITANWQRIAAQARTDADAATEMLAQWFVTEQIEEEDRSVKLLQKVMLGGNAGLIVLDAGLAK